jgi:phospholipid transport system substrate-binding protein
MKHYKSFKAALLYFLVYLSLFAFPVWADTPTVVIKAAVDQAINTLTDPNLQGEDKEMERRAQLHQIFFPRFDFREMAKRSLGAHWRERTHEDKSEFVRIFTDLLEKVILSKIESYNNGEKFIYSNERIDGHFAKVSSKILTSDDEEFQINYKLHQVEEKWKIYDVVVEDISLVNNYRSQFNRIITRTSYDELVSRMKQKLSDTTEK